MKYGISELSIIPVRKEPDNRSEMTTQLLFGESFIILEEENTWIYIRINNDDYEGWIDSQNITRLTDKTFENIILNSNEVVKNITEPILINKNESLVLPMGSILPNLTKNHDSFSIGKNQYQLLNKYNSESFEIIKLAKLFLNAPYLWGGKSFFGIDCSGFVQVICKAVGVQIPRDTSQQVQKGENISFSSEAQPGDLAFFDDEEGNIIHVGIILGNNEIIHSSGKVRIDKIDQQGIFNFELNKYTHKLRVIKRIK
ncbi:MAG: C40 family peptidase [Bacteroidales bacterium]|nr:C40 family peptidase [Bacteroidales bacterium]